MVEKQRTILVPVPYKDKPHLSADDNAFLRELSGGISHETRVVIKGEELPPGAIETIGEHDIRPEQLDPQPDFTVIDE